MIAERMPRQSSDATASAGVILVVDDHATARRSLADILEHAGYEVDCCASAVEAIARLDERGYDLIITDLNMPGMNGLEFIATVRGQSRQTQIVMVTAYASVATAVEAMRHGVFAYIAKPFNADQIESLVARALSQSETKPKTAAAPGEKTPVHMIGDSPAMQQLQAAIAKVAPTDETVLITGESGTGKELVAQAIHAASQRASGALVSLNCPVLSAQLMESELFGHERGAFTSADAPRVGRFELAEGGSLLLDEITEIDVSLQAKLLRVLQERTFERVGSSRSIRTDVRVLATTNRDIRREVEEGNFREDLYFRLAVVPIAVPPLRDRREDVPQLASHFLQAAATRLGRPACMLAADACALLTEYHWPGNVRELENVMTRASVLHVGEVTADDVRPWLIAQERPRSDEELPVGTSLEEMEQRLIEATLEHFDGHRQKTAQALGIGVRTLSTKLRNYGLAPRAKTFRDAA